MIRLTSSNYSIWKPRMKDILYCKDLYAPIDGDNSKPKDMSEAEWKIMHRKTVALIRQWVDQSVFHHVSQESNATELWKKLESMYERKTAQNKATLIRRLVNLKYKNGHSVAEHTSDFQGLVNQLNALKMKIEDELQALLLLSSLPDSWDTLVISLSNSAPNGNLTMDMVKDSLFNEEARRKEQGISSETEALVTENRRRGKNRKPKGHGKSKGRSQSRGKSSERRKCYHCGKEGHMKRNCYAWKRKQKEGKNQRKDENKNTTAALSDEDVAVLFFGDEECLPVTDNEVEWIIDTAASYHVTPNKEFFTSYRLGDFGTVKMGNTSYSKIVGIGDVCIQTDVGCSLTLRDVRHVPDLRLNLISGVALDREGYVNYFSNGKWKLTKGSLVAARGKVRSTLYRTVVKICGDELNATEDGSSPNLWHKRLGHMSEKGLHILAKKALIPFAKGNSLNPCDYCLFGKHHRVSFSKSSKRKSNILELVYSDVCGPFEVESLGGNRYFVTFIDDASRKVWVYLLKAKDQVYQFFQKFHALVERETGKFLKCLRTDNGGEYTSKEFRNYCSAHGIRHEKTVPGTPQHNGVAERMNRTIVEKVRCMLKMAKLPKVFWGEAIRTACYLINRSPSVPLEFDIPEKVWTGKDVAYNHLKVFGCKAFAHVPKEQRSKLDDKAFPCILVGYGNEEFGYRLWDPVKKKIFRSRYVIFYEDQTISDCEKTEKVKAISDGVIDPTVIHIPLQRTIDGGAEMTGDEAPETVVDDGMPESDQAVEQGEQPPQQVISEPQIRRTNRESRPSSKYPSSEYVLITDEGEPENFQEVQTHADKVSWIKAMQEEMHSLLKNDTYELVELPKGRKALRNKWVFKLKKDSDGKFLKYKARLVVKGFGQKKGIDFDEIFSPVVKMSSIRVVLSLTASLDLELEQLDVKTAFLHGDLNEEIYMSQPEGFEVKGKEHMVCKLKKSLYGLKQAPRQWYKKFDSFMVSHEYKRQMQIIVFISGSLQMVTSLFFYFMLMIC